MLRAAALHRRCCGCMRCRPRPPSRRPSSHPRCTTLGQLPSFPTPPSCCQRLKAPHRPLRHRSRSVPFGAGRRLGAATFGGARSRCVHRRLRWCSQQVHDSTAALKLGCSCLLVGARVFLASRRTTSSSLHPCRAGCRMDAQMERAGRCRFKSAACGQRIARCPRLQSAAQACKSHQVCAC